MKLLIFTYAPAGLGHLRVTDALVESRPKHYPYVVLGSYDRFITKLHRIFSRNFFARKLYFLGQHGVFEDIFSFVYRFLLVKTANEAYVELKEVISKHNDINEVWIIATHFSMAHQIGAIKERLIRETGKSIKLIVQVTDDTSQHIWSVRGADLTFVPSLDTKIDIKRYSDRLNMNLTIEVSPYPICPALTKKLSIGSLRSKALSSSNDQINVSVPISGAAVGLTYLTRLFEETYKLSKRFMFWVVVKQAVYTEVFLSNISRMPNVKLITGKNDNEMISLYDLMYQNNTMHIEITKPSEQSFKAMLPPDLNGGSVMLFVTPVGRQETDNIDFLIKHKLLAGTSKIIIPRAIRISKDPKIAASFIVWGLETGMFTKMSSKNFKFSKKTILSGEVGPSGADRFWEIVKEHFD